MTLKISRSSPGNDLLECQVDFLVAPGEPVLAFSISVLVHHVFEIDSDGVRAVLIGNPALSPVFVIASNSSFTYKGKPVKAILERNDDALLAVHGDPCP